MKDFNFASNQSNHFSSRRSKDVLENNILFKISNDSIKDATNKCTIYIGEFKNGVSEGFGELFLPNGEYFKGEFKNNKCHGKGEYHYKDNKIYRGVFNNNKIEDKSLIDINDSKISMFKIKFGKNIDKDN